MTSDGDRIEAHVQLVRLLINRDEPTFDEALAAAAGHCPCQRITKRSRGTTGSRLRQRLRF